MKNFNVLKNNVSTIYNKYIKYNTGYILIGVLVLIIFFMYKALKHNTEEFLIYKQNEITYKETINRLSLTIKNLESETDRLVEESNNLSIRNKNLSRVKAISNINLENSINNLNNITNTINNNSNDTLYNISTKDLIDNFNNDYYNSNGKFTRFKPFKLDKKQ